MGKMFEFFFFLNNEPNERLVFRSVNRYFELQNHVVGLLVRLDELLMDILKILSWIGSTLALGYEKGGKLTNSSQSINENNIYFCDQTSSCIVDDEKDLSSTQAAAALPK